MLLGIAMDKSDSAVIHERFGRFLLDHRMTDEDHLRHYLNWVTACHHYLHQDVGSPLIGQDINRYLSHLGTHRDEWQVRQAEHAVRLYSYYAGMVAEGATISPAHDHDVAWHMRAEKMREALHLRHRSRRTEQAWTLDIHNNFAHPISPAKAALGSSASQARKARFPLRSNKQQSYISNQPRRRAGFRLRLNNQQFFLSRIRVLSAVPR